MSEDVMIDQIKVLFVDDEENILKALTRLMMDEAFETVTATSGEEGLSLLRSTEGVGVVVSDQRMPGMTGAEFLEKVREEFPETLRLVLTGYADLNATMDAINKGGAFRYISKPWKDEEFLQTIRDAVNRALLVAENRRLAALVQKQNEELTEWNASLKERVLSQTVQIRKQNEELQALNERLKLNYRHTIEAFSGLVEMVGSRLRNHSKNVAGLAFGVAKAQGLSNDEIEAIQVAALLHDIGEIGTPPELLHKSPAEMNDDELKEYLQHAVRGQTAIDAIEDLRPVGVMIRHHHEYFDGSGFPDRLQGEAIPLGARIIAIADQFDRIMERFSGSHAIEMALNALQGEIGHRVDPSLLPALKKQANIVYFTKSSASGSLVECELQPKELLVGMILARDLCSGTGMLLLGKGNVLDETKIAAIKRYYRLDPPSGGVAVLVKR